MPSRATRPDSGVPYQRPKITDSREDVRAGQGLMKQVVVPRRAGRPCRPSGPPRRMKVGGLLVVAGGSLTQTVAASAETAATDPAPVNLMFSLGPIDAGMSVGLAFFVGLVIFSTTL